MIEVRGKRKSLVDTRTTHRIPTQEQWRELGLPELTREAHNLKKKERKKEEEGEERRRRKEKEDKRRSKWSCRLKIFTSLQLAQKAKKQRRGKKEKLKGREMTEI